MKWVAIASIVQKHEHTSEWVIIDHDYFDSKKECENWITECKNKCNDKNIAFSYERVDKEDVY